MKKTRLFIFITALLITLLMVVGCDVSPSINTSIPRGCVEVSLKVVDSRSLNAEMNFDSQTVVHWGYALKSQWNDQDFEEKIYGNVSYSELPDNGYLGWVTPGLWKVTVYALGEGGTPLYIGEELVYINDENNCISVYMKPYSYQDNNPKLLFNITNRDIVDIQTGYDTYYIYTIKDINGNVVEVQNSEGFVFSSNGTQKTITTLPAGYYNVFVGLYIGKKGLTSIEDVKNDSNSEMIGGEVLGVYLPAFSEATITGVLEPSDFVKGQLDISLVIVSGSISHDYNTIDTEITFTLKDSTMADSEKNNYNIAYDWYVNGVKESDQTTETEFTYKFSTYGPKEVSCVVTYQHKELTERVYTATIKDSFTITP